MKVERRTVASDITPSDDGMSFTGHAAVFGQRAYIGPPKRGFYEEVSPGAFDKVLASKPDVAMAFNHNPDNLLARTASGTLTLAVDKTGLRTDAQLPDTTLGRDVRELIRRGDIRGQSYQFVVAKDSWATIPGGHSQLRTIEEYAELIDVGPVTYPAFEATTASVRTALETAPAEVRTALLADEEPAARPRARRATPPAADDDTKALIAAVDAAVDNVVTAAEAAEDTVDQLMQRLGIYDPPDEDEDEATSTSERARRGRRASLLRTRLRLAQLTQGVPVDA